MEMNMNIGNEYVGHEKNCMHCVSTKSWKGYLKKQGSI